MLGAGPTKIQGKLWSALKTPLTFEHATGKQMNWGEETEFSVENGPPGKNPVLPKQNWGRKLHVLRKHHLKLFLKVTKKHVV